MITAIVTLFTIIGIVSCLLVANVIFRIIVGLFTIAGIIIVGLGLIANIFTIPVWLTLVVITTIIITLRSMKNETT
jgi:hypothetical protein